MQFGARSTFKNVADKYFQGCRPLTEGGACIAACYPAGAAEDFGISYQERSYGEQQGSRSAWRVLLPYLANPVHLGDWVWNTLTSIWREIVMMTPVRNRIDHASPELMRRSVPRVGRSARTFSVVLGRLRS